MCMLPKTAILTSPDAMVASKWPQLPKRSNLTSNLKSIAQILHDTTFGLAILASVWPLFIRCVESLPLGSS